MYLNNILIYIEDNRNSYIVAIQWVLKQLKKFLLYTNLKKYQFHQDEVWFLGYVMSLKSIRMEGKQIEAIKQ